jgi:hypothetical protein
MILVTVFITFCIQKWPNTVTSILCTRNLSRLYVYVPAHNFMCQQHTAHLRVLVLALVHDGLWVKTELAALLQLAEHCL